MVALAALGWFGTVFVVWMVLILTVEIAVALWKLNRIEEETDGRSGNREQGEGSGEMKRTEHEEQVWEPAWIETRAKFCKDCARARRTPKGAYYCEKNQKFVAKKFWCEHFRNRNLNRKQETGNRE